MGEFENSNILLDNERKGSRHSWKRLVRDRSSSFDESMSTSGKRKALFDEEKELCLLLGSSTKRTKFRVSQPSSLNADAIMVNNFNIIETHSFRISGCQ